ncbi:MAG: hypothetical protein E7589_00560 [Ruminococcaceae bacterium]|nr:hypothetical protein [Oscillospiraceae bacterium]
MIKLLIGVKGTGKTKTLIEKANAAVASTKGNVVVVEKGVKLRLNIDYNARLLNTNDYLIFDGEELYGFVAGILASNNDITDLFIDSALKICNNDMPVFEKFLLDLDELTAKSGNEINILITASMAAEEASEVVKKYL